MQRLVFHIDLHSVFQFGKFKWLKEQTGTQLFSLSGLILEKSEMKSFKAFKRKRA